VLRDHDRAAQEVDDVSEDAEQLWTKAKEIEAQLPIRKREAFAELKRRFPQMKYLKFGSLAIAARQGRLDVELASAVAQYVTEFEALESEARRCRLESDRLYNDQAASDKRKWLDPAVDPIPAGEYPKLRVCLTYPLRQNCNYGENTESRWGRCEYMKYDDSKSIQDPARWFCAAPK
jgi:hypothetical protein